MDSKSRDSKLLWDSWLILSTKFDEINLKN